MSKSSKLAKVLARIEVENAAEPVWIVGQKTGRLLHWLVRVTEPKIIFEVGTSVGYSALWMADALESNEDGELWTVESHEERFERAEQNIGESGLGHRITQIKGHVPEIFKDGRELPEKVDLAFFDATKKQHQDFLDVLLPRMESGGLIVVDNVHSHRFGEMLKFIKSTHEREDFQVVEVPVGDGLLIARIV